MKDPYETLGVERSASLEEVTKAYRRLAKKYHPDLNPNDPGAQKKMAEINVAYEEIKSGRATYSGRPSGQTSSAYGPFGGFDPFSFGGFRYETAQPQSLETVQSLVNAGRFQEALLLLHQMPVRNAQWYALSATCHYELGNIVTAQQHIRAAVQMDPANTEYLLLQQQMEQSAQAYTAYGRTFGFPRATAIGRFFLTLWLCFCCRFCC